MRSRGMTGVGRGGRLLGWSVAGFAWLGSISVALLPAWERRSRWFLLVPLTGIAAWLVLWRQIRRRAEAWERQELVACASGAGAALALAVILSIRG